MYNIISKNDFRDEFRRYGREDYFSYEGLGALYDWLEEMYDWLEELDGAAAGPELDVIALCCEFSEYDSAR